MSLQIGLSRLGEIRFVRHLNAHGVGVPLLASFQNGLVYKLMSGESVEMKTEGNIMNDPTFARYERMTIFRNTT